MKSFHFEGLATRVLFGSGTLPRLIDEVVRLKLARVLLLTTPQQTELARQAQEILGDHVAGSFHEAAMHTPIEITERAMALVADRKIDGIVALGGGSTIGLGKAIAFRTDLPQIVVPTTYAGSEMTPILGETAAGAKVTKRDQRIQPEIVLYDVDLTLTLPAPNSVTSGLNAMAHAVEALYAVDGNPISNIMAEEGIRALAQALPQIVADQRDKEARAAALYGAWLCGTCLGQVGMALHHKLCHTLGGSFGLPHAETHSVILPHAIAYNSVATDAMARIARALNIRDNPALALYEMASRLGAPLALRDLGMPKDAIDRAAAIAAANPYPNPRPVEELPIRNLLRRAWAGEAPSVDGRST